MTPSGERLSRWHELVTLQTNIAESWLKRGRDSEDRFAQFFFFFSAFNALYFLWATLDGIRGSEGAQIDHLLKKYTAPEAEEILRDVAPQVAYFCERRPISRMDRRPADTPDVGEVKEGHKLQEILRSGSDAVERLAALGRILYLVRCNLVHGSKLDRGDDADVVGAAILPLKVLAASASTMTRRKTQPA